MQVHVDYFSLAKNLPFGVEEREVISVLSPITKLNNSYTFTEKCETIHGILRKISHESQGQMSICSKMTIFSMIHSITMRHFRTVQFDILVEAQDTKDNFAYIFNWINTLLNTVHTYGLPLNVKAIYENFIFNKMCYYTSMYLDIKEEIEILQSSNPPTYLRDNDSITLCPSLKDKLDSSTKTLVDATNEDICTVCIEKTISEQDNFAILDACVHLFCKLCIGKWFKDA